MSVEFNNINFLLLTSVIQYRPSPHLVGYTVYMSVEFNNRLPAINCDTIQTFTASSWLGIVTCLGGFLEVIQYRPSPHLVGYIGTCLWSLITLLGEREGEGERVGYIGSLGV